MNSATFPCSSYSNWLFSLQAALFPWISVPVFARTISTTTSVYLSKTYFNQPSCWAPLSTPREYRCWITPIASIYPPSYWGHRSSFLAVLSPRFWGWPHSPKNLFPQPMKYSEVKAIWTTCPFFCSTLQIILPSLLSSSFWSLWFRQVALSSTRTSAWTSSTSTRPGGGSLWAGKWEYSVLLKFAGSRRSTSESEAAHFSNSYSGWLPPCQKADF